ncbi:MAG: PASTA domain-containing protein [Candidatus Tectomicrobia bacterium]|uniref:PASTA domain-containing protein n=1 Tax=Tectimicrobiota bacterium TaxID=2528274 RepID=A0A932MMK2_UNCTE|nr:PASTA domain-containing protein [Candidatus Tectomicrobia bacterium]
MRGVLRGLFAAVLLFLAGAGGGIAGLYLFQEGESVFLPNVAGMDVVRALEILGERGIPLQVAERVFSDAVPQNHVVGTNPSGGRRIRKGRTVSLVISQGSREVAVPAVKGENMARAETLVLQQGLRVGWVERLFDPKRPVDEVIGIWPGEGKAVSRGEAVVLLVSQGPRERAYVMPSLVGEPVNAALDRVREVGLNVGRVRYVDRQGALRGTIVAQIPPAGQRVLAGHRVHVDVARGGDQITGNFSVLRYRVPSGRPAQKLRIELETGGEKREVLSREVNAGEEIQIMIPSTGRTWARIYLDGQLMEEQAH